MSEEKSIIKGIHVSRRARDRYRFDASLFAASGTAVFPNFRATRAFAQTINQKRDLVRFPEQTVKAGQLNAMSLIDEILPYVVHLFRQQKNPEVVRQAMDWLEEKLGPKAVESALLKYVDEFPPVAVYQRQVTPQAYLAGETNGVPNRQVVMEGMLILWLTNVNPAASPFMELADDSALERETSYLQVISNLRQFFETQPGFGPEDQNLVDMLHSPAVAVPYSLSGQLDYIRERWAFLLGSYLYRLLQGLDLLREEEKAIFAGPGPAQVLEFAGLGLEAERYSADRDWMPRVVLIAKSTYVWLDQLSKRYQRAINRLDQVPDEELDILARWGFTGLWLIGLWERSRASQIIKQHMGNPEAVASAYSLYDYSIAADLGGDEAYQNLRARAWSRGIRLASDMVPNHMGLDSRWVIEHPDWFVALDYSPFPSYSFNGPDLSADARVGVFLEDHYYDRSDAAVVFKRVDRWTGSEKYIYHGNDGTSMPWNDTAQLNFLNPNVREAVIQTILHVARKFPIIRFDAAMTLAKKHIQRLWFPEPGTGGAIASRAEHGLTKAQFDAAIPEEFWREVVDRVAQEVPDTLLLAEAFWLMEGYFVRTLGMHRVYNSAFMNMLKTEDNAKYRSSMKNVLEFDPQIMKRYVNFMNNPDEETAVAQFGKDDKYFGVCTMMVTLPGLPMIGHGQIEGFTEKYGMEYRRAYWDEQPDWHLVRRHEREIFPLMHRRYIFAGVENFLLYDFFTPEGTVNENVFAYSNSSGDSLAGPGERGFVLYNNKYENTRGWIRTSAAYSEGSAQAAERKLVQRTLGEGLGLRPDGNYFCIFRDHVTGLEYIRNCKELNDKGFYAELGAFKYQVFLDFREVQDDEWHHYANLTAYLAGRGVPSINETLGEIFLQPVLQPFKEVVNAAMLRALADARLTSPDAPQTARDFAPQTARDLAQWNDALLDDVEQKMVRVFREARQFSSGTGDEVALARNARAELEAILQLPVLEDRFPASDELTSQQEYQAAAQYLPGNLKGDLRTWATLLGWWSVHALGRAAGQDYFDQQSRSWIDEWRLGRILAAAFQELGMAESDAGQAVTMIKLLTSHQGWPARAIAVGVHKSKRGQRVLHSLLEDSEVQQFLQVNRFQEVLWFNKEAFDQLLGWLLLVATVEATAGSGRDRLSGDVMARIAVCYDIIHQLHEAGRKSGYQVERLLAAV